MDTVVTDEPAIQEPDTDTPETETTEENADGDTSTDGQQEDAAALQKRLADKDRYIKELEKAKSESEKKKEKPDTRSKDIQELEWKLENKERINLVKDEYERILVDGYQGEKVSKKIALELAEKQAKVDSTSTRRDRQDDMTTASVTTRNVDPKGYEDELDQRLGLTIEKKKKLEARHPHLKQS